MKAPKGLRKFLLYSAVSFMCLGTFLVAGLALYLNPRLPSVESLRDIKLQIPLKIYSADNRLIAEFGEKRRTPIAFEQAPKLFIQAIMAAEDDGFYKHHGISIKSMIRVGIELLTPGGRQTGGSTITMQVARNYLLTLDRTVSRKFNEMLLTIQIEQLFSKDEILELYINKIYLGHRAYGFQAASQVYYGKDLRELALEQLAMLAALPKAPSTLNPITNPERALARRNWILGRMLALDYINQPQYDAAISAPVTAVYHGLQPELEAPYLAEMVRSEMLKRYSKSDVYTTGMRVYTTVQSDLQNSANRAVRNGLLAYDRRHGYRGPEQSFLLDVADPQASAREYLQDTSSIGQLIPAIVVNIGLQNARVLVPSGEIIELAWEGLKWARPYLSTNAMGRFPKKADDIFKLGDQIRIRKDSDDQWVLAQVPEAQSAFVALAPDDGGILALVGGFNYQHSKFNRATQALRQPGSNFKPFLYTAALDKGYTAASVINDAPVVFDDPLLEAAWRPENYGSKFYGPTRLRQALYKSQNMVSIRLLRALTLPSAISYVKRFGFDEKRLPRDLSLALGSAEFTPLEIATGYATFANGGYKVNPYLIEKIVGNDSNILFHATPETVCRNCSDDPTGALREQSITSETALEQAVLAEIEETSDKPAQIQDTEPSAAENLPEVLSEITLPESITRKLPTAPRVLEPRIAYIMDTILKDVINLGSGRKARQLGRKDLAGKTGTANDQKDAWFSGYNHNIVASAWVGFDQPRTLGKYEIGGFAALPIWIDFMREALAGSPETGLIQPEGLVTVRIDPTTGERSQAGQADAIFEIFRTEHAPTQIAGNGEVEGLFEDEEESIPEQLF